MKIKSPFKDYYDFVANQYGGGDPSIVYVRNRISPLNKTSNFGDIHETHLTIEIDGNCPLRSPDYTNLRGEEIRQKYLIIAGKAYIIQKISGFFEEDVNSYRVIPPEILKKDEEDNKHRFWRKGYGVEIAKENPFLIELSRKIGHPVYVISSVSYGSIGQWRSKLGATIRISGQCPILKDIGMPALIPATQMYQDLAYFVGNTMKLVPDSAPPVTVSNKEKILKAGFDLRLSFRHRK
jgi:hypothetical protein